MVDYHQYAVRGTISELKGIQYCRLIPSKLWLDIISTAREDVQYFVGISQVLCSDTIQLWKMFSTVEDIHYCRGYDVIRML